MKSAKLKKLSAPAKESTLQSALGLTTTEAENTFALSVVETTGIDAKVAAREKARTLKRKGLIEVIEATTGLDDFGGIVGQSEANLRTVIQTAEAIAPCVLWIDEIEKGFSGSKSSGSTDGGTSSRVFGSFLSWMQEKQKAVFVVATANDVSRLPPEFLRKGRFDEMFFVDLPDARERAQIWDIVIARHGRKPSGFDTVVLVRACEQFTGAEIEAVFIEAIHEAYVEGKEPGAKQILEAITRTVPLAQLMDGKIAALRHWAKGRAREAASQPPRTPRRTRRVQSMN